MHGRHSLAARVGLMRGAPYRKSQVSLSAEGCAEVHMCWPPTVICTLKARRLCFRQSRTHVAAPKYTQLHRTSNFQISDKRSQTSWTRVVRVLGAKLLASSTLSWNCAKLNHIVPLHQYTYPSSETMSGPQSLSLYPPFFTPHRVCRSALWAQNGPPIGMLISLLHSSPTACNTLLLSSSNFSIRARRSCCNTQTFHSWPPPPCPALGCLWVLPNAVLVVATAAFWPATLFPCQTPVSRLWGVCCQKSFCSPPL